MYSIGDCVVHSNNGICTIDDVVMMNMQDGNKEYYLLIPINDKNAKVYIPINNTGRQRMRMAMDEGQARQLINNIDETDAIPITNDRERERVYREATTSNDPYRLLSVIKTIFQRKTEREKNGKKSTAVDEKYLKLAETQLYEELAHALQSETKQIEQTVIQRIFTEISI